MSSRTGFDLAADTWVKVATAVQRGTIHIVTQGQYVQTFVPTTDPPPTDDTLAAPLCEGGAPIGSLNQVDVYVKCRGAAGRVLVDL